MTVDRSDVILQGIVGSTAYGLAHEGSDEDRLGIYVAPLRSVLGVGGPHVVEDSLVRHDPDLTLHEVGKYVRLALSANPTILELLWLPDYEIQTLPGEILCAHRFHFLSEPKVKGRYGGYAKAQAERLLRRDSEGKAGFSSDVKNRTAKHGRHCYRLLLQGAQLLREGRMTVNVGDHRDELFEAGERAAANPQAFYDEIMNKLAEFDLIESVLPDTPDTEVINTLLIDIRWSRGLTGNPLTDYLKVIG